MGELTHSIIFDREKCVACVACCKACPTKTIRVRDDRVVVNPDLCIDCGECIRVCPHYAVSARTSSPSDLKKFKYTVAIPSTPLYTQFGCDVHPTQVAQALTRVGFDAYYDISWMCEMVSRAIDTYLSECSEPWPKISVYCPAIVRLVQIRYPDLLPHLVPVESPRELAAKLIRRMLSAQRGLAPEEIGIFFITQCSAILHSIVCPVGLEESYIDGAFSVAELYGPLRKAIKSAPPSPIQVSFSPRGLGWAAVGGESATMRNANTLAVSGVADVTHVFDRIESGRFQSLDFIEAYICPDGCVSGQLLVEGRYTARRTLREILRRLGPSDPVKEEKVRSMFREHFFDFEEEVKARTVKPLARDLQQAIRLKKEKEDLLSRLPLKDCAACGAPDCQTLAEDILGNEAALDDCVFRKIKNPASSPRDRGPGA